MTENIKASAISTATQRRADGAVGDLGVIETGLPSKVGSVNGDGSVTTASRGGQIRTNRTFLRTKRDSLDSRLPVGRARVVKCEIPAGGGGVSSLLSNLKKGKNNNGTNTTILHPMRVDIPAGSITAILGTAQSGKSTLLKFLAGCMDKNMVYDGLVNLPGSSSYLPEETHLHRFYTARTYIEHYDRLLSAGTGNASRDTGDENASTSNLFNRKSFTSPKMASSDVDRLLDSLRIDADRRDTIVGDAFARGLNPGEQRRLELGLQVLGAPDNIFCEDPVAGLDSETSLHVMEFLKGYISKSNQRRAIVTLNKPSLFVWNLIDNVILLSKGRIVYEGPRFDMENFFAFHKRPTPKRFSPLEHYLAVVNNFRSPDAAVNWETAFKQWQEEAEDDEGDTLADDIETCFPSAIPDVIIPRQISVQNGNQNGPAQLLSRLCCCSGWGQKFMVLLHRYLLNMIKNPGMLLIRLVMYTGLSLVLGLLFYNLNWEDDSQAVNSCAALLFYSSSFFIFMVVAVMPFLAHDNFVRDKEILNGHYHPVTAHLAMTVASIPGFLLLSIVITGILCGMVKLQNAGTFFSVLTLALWCAESYAFLMSLCVRNYIIAIVLLAGIFGVSMPLQGFMLVPSKFSKWLFWTHQVPFHTYAWRSLMYNEFSNTSYGNQVLKSYEIEDTNITHDIVVLFCYGCIIQLVCLGILFLKSSANIMAPKIKEE